MPVQELGLRLFEELDRAQVITKLILPVCGLCPRRASLPLDKEVAHMYHNELTLSNKDEWISIAEAARRSGYHEEYLRKSIRHGKLVAQKSKKSWLVDWSFLQLYIQDLSGVRPGRRSYSDISAQFRSQN